jgi:hypothetical protein
MPIEPLLGGSYEGYPNASVDEVSVAELMTQIVAFLYPNLVLAPVLKYREGGLHVHMRS